jgi:cytochrome c-type biogenesis protein CcmH/NrfG
MRLRLASGRSARSARTPLKRRHLSDQRGWIALVGVLIALVIVAVLAQTVLKSYGLLSAPETAGRAGPPPVSAAGPAPTDPTAATLAPTAPLERARGVERELQRDAQDLARRIDESAK